jgi:hypothetical protein
MKKEGGQQEAVGSIEYGTLAIKVGLVLNLLSSFR